MSISPLAALGAATLLLAPLAAAVAAPAPKQEVLAEVSADFNGDGIKDRAVLLHAPDGDDVDLAIYLSAGGKTPSQPTLYKTALGWTGAMAGSTPELSVNKAGSLVVLFQNDSIGRDRWSQQLTIAYRGGALVVAGYDYTARDTLAPGQGGNCDVNYLSGKASRNGKAVKFTATSIRLSDWTDKSAPAFCEF